MRSSTWRNNQEDHDCETCSLKEYDWWDTFVRNEIKKKSNEWWQELFWSRKEQLSCWWRKETDIKLSFWLSRNSSDSSKEDSNEESTRDSKKDRSEKI